MSLARCKVYESYDLFKNYGTRLKDVFAKMPNLPVYDLVKTFRRRFERIFEKM